MDGFSLHAARTVEADDREGLERLCRYGLRSPLSLERLSVDSEGRVQYMAELSGRSSARTKPMPFGYRLRKPWFDGRTEIVFDPIGNAPGGWLGRTFSAESSTSTCSLVRSATHL